MPTCERLDDEHHRAAVDAHEGRSGRFSAATFGLLDLPAWRIGHKQLARLLDAIPPMGIGQQPVVPDAMEATGQHMQQEAAHELLRRERHRLVACLALAAYFGECDRSFRRIVTGGLSDVLSAVSVT
mgnify:CR=1 FL=1